MLLFACLIGRNCFEKEILLVITPVSSVREDVCASFNANYAVMPY